MSFERHVGVPYELCGTSTQTCVCRHNRHRALQAAGPFDLHVVGFMPCRSTKIDELEGRMHRRFKRLHHRGEWFRRESPLIEFIESLKADG